MERQIFLIYFLTVFFSITSSLKITISTNGINAANGEVNATRGNEVVLKWNIDNIPRNLVRGAIIIFKIPLYSEYTCSPNDADLINCYFLVRAQDIIESGFNKEYYVGGIILEANRYSVVERFFQDFTSATTELTIKNVQFSEGGRYLVQLLDSGQFHGNPSELRLNVRGQENDRMARWVVDGQDLEVNPGIETRMRIYNNTSTIECKVSKIADGATTGDSLKYKVELNDIDLNYRFTTIPADEEFIGPKNFDALHYEVISSGGRIKQFNTFGSDHGKLFRCSSVDNAGNKLASQLARLELYFSPEIMKDDCPSVQYVTMGLQKQAIKCRVLANPPPKSVKFFFGAISVTSDHPYNGLKIEKKYNIETPYNVTYSLVFMSALTHTDLRNYSLTIVNKYGVLSTEIEVRGN